MEHLLLRETFSTPGSHGFLSIHDNQTGQDPTLIHFTIDGRHGILGARHIAEALQIPYEPTQFDDFRAWTNPTELEMVRTLSRGAANRSFVEGGASSNMFLIDAFLRHNLYPLQHWTQRRGVLLESPLQDVRRIFFGPHHLILAALLYFRREALGYPFEPQLERKRICHEPFTLDKWNNMTAYKVDQQEPPQPAARRASPRHIPEEMAAIRACQEQMLATQAQQAAILRQLQLHFDLPPAVEPSTSTPAVPHSHPSEFSSSRAPSTS
ncbi:hypothetical protein CK203_115887 [Vitis vinifera]|uniref:Uncharacterized protein n=1 Tax=Vitis vinifera TaxID=29760 RepID=A0A438BNR8_VITVI|nr:hypothetical protein CK203_115887 [Vitis vinifera]